MLNTAGFLPCKRFTHRVETQGKGMYARNDDPQVDLRDLGDADLIRRFKLGSDEALDALLERHSDALFRFSYQLTGNREDAEDITQETMARALARVDTLHSGAAFRTWLFRIARNLSIDTFRRRKKICPLPEEETTSFPLQEDGPQDRVELGEEHQSVATALHNLADSHQKVLMLREVEGLSYAEISRRMNVSQSAVETLLFRARRRLKEEYSKVAALPGLAVFGSLRDLALRFAAPLTVGPPLAAKVVVTAALVGGGMAAVPRVVHTLPLSAKHAAPRLTREAPPVASVIDSVPGRALVVATQPYLSSRSAPHLTFLRGQAEARGVRIVSFAGPTRQMHPVPPAMRPRSSEPVTSRQRAGQAGLVSPGATGHSGATASSDSTAVSVNTVPIVNSAPNGDISPDGGTTSPGGRGAASRTGNSVSTPPLPSGSSSNGAPVPVRPPDHGSAVSVPIASGTVAGPTSSSSPAKEAGRNGGGSQPVPPSTGPSAPSGSPGRAPERNDPGHGKSYPDRGHHAAPSPTPAPSEGNGSTAPSGRGNSSTPVQPSAPTPGADPTQQRNGKGAGGTEPAPPTPPAVSAPAPTSAPAMPAPSVPGGSQPGSTTRGNGNSDETGRGGNGTGNARAGSAPGTPAPAAGNTTSQNGPSVTPGNGSAANSGDRGSSNGNSGNNGGRGHSKP